MARLFRTQPIVTLPANYMSFSEDYTKFTWLTGGTGAAIPHAYSAGTSLAVGTKQALPDIPGGEAGKGFTCTGMCVDPDNGNLWIGNFGSSRGAGGGSTTPLSIVQTSANGATYISQVQTTQGLGGLQGIAFVTSGALKCLAYVSGADNQIRFVNRDGSVPRSNITLPFVVNALAWDDALQGFWAGDAASPMGYLVSIHGILLRAVDFAFSGFSAAMDQFCVDPSRGTAGYLWATAGANGSPGVVFIYDKAKDIIVNRYLLADAQAVEGLLVQGTTLKTVSDGYYHSTGSAPNTVAPYNVNELQTYAVPSTIPQWRYARVYRASELVGPYGTAPYHMLLDRGDGDTSADFCFLTRIGDAAITGQVANVAWTGKSFDPAVTANLGVRLLSGGSAVNKTLGADWTRISTSATYANGANDTQIGTRGTQTPDRVVNVVGSALAINTGATPVLYKPRLGA